MDSWRKIRIGGLQRFISIVKVRVRLGGMRVGSTALDDCGERSLAL